MKKLKKIEGSCAVVALHYVSGIDEDTVIRICGFHGFEIGAGMSDDQWQESAVELGVKFHSRKTDDCTLRQFLKKYPIGLYLVGTFDHLFVVDNGLIIDPRNDKPPGLGRIIKQAWRINK